jgi:hypothetical protein
MNDQEDTQRDEHPALEELRKVCEEIVDRYGYDPLDSPFG